MNLPPRSTGKPLPTSMVPEMYSISQGTPWLCRTKVRTFRNAFAAQHVTGNVLNIDGHPLALQDKGAAVPERHNDDLLAAEGLQRGIGILDDDRLVFLDQLSKKSDDRVDVVFIPS